MHRDRSRSGLSGALAALPMLFLACTEPGGSAADPPPQNTTTSATDGGYAGGRDEGGTADQSAYEPPGLPNVPLDSVAGVLTLFASTLKAGPNGLELYAAIRNDGMFPLCGAAMMIEFYDQADQLIGSASGGVQSGRVYRFPDSEMTISCVGPGQIAMAAATTLPEGLVLEDLKYLGHRFPAFQIDGAEPLAGATVSEVEAYSTAGGTAYRGSVVNASDTPISDPTISVFPVNAVGRPLGVATSTAMVEIPPGGTWSFETSAVTERGVDTFAFATAIAAPMP